MATRTFIPIQPDMVAWRGTMSLNSYHFPSPNGIGYSHLPNSISIKSKLALLKIKLQAIITRIFELI